MANTEDVSRDRRARRRRKSHSVLEDEKLDKSGAREPVTHEPDVDELRRIRIERLEGTTSSSGPAASSNMATETPAPASSPKGSSSHRRKHHRSTEDGKKHRRKKTSAKDDSGATYVYGAPADKPRSAPAKISETRRLGRDGDPSQSEEGEAAKAGDDEEQPKSRKVRVVYVEKDGSRSKPKERRVRTEAKEEGESGHRSRGHRSRRRSVTDATGSAHKRSASADARPSLRRSNTTSARLPSREAQSPTVTPLANTSAKRASLFGGLFGSPAPQHTEPEKLVECLTCLSDDIPRSKSAKLKCGHRMCHSCLRRIFKLSISDPQHMPPKCCTADHIPLKHVDRLFDDNFKRNWNRKFQEYSTKNRIYCPGKRCGEWIRPQNIHKEDGKKFGKCTRCKTKVCCLCNGKWHGTKDCPKDEETNKLLEAAKKAGWQRCYNCRTMVELKEGCNHMTCRCTAEFCMICGLKWKSCNCPWFNYETVEADRLEHMQVPQEADEPTAEVEPRQRRLRRPPRPRGYREELAERRLQQYQEAELARRFERARIEDHDDDYQGGIGDIQGIGNGAGHFMNQNYIRTAQNILAGGIFGPAAAAANYVMGRGEPRPGPAPQERMAGPYPIPGRPARPPSPPVPLLRRHTMRENAYNSAQSTRPSERVVPRRTRTDYAAEAAVHAPLGRRSQDSGEARAAVLAGLSGLGRSGNRVSAWRNHIEVGVTPEEGMFSMP